jgi:hypothetical protein
MRTVRELVIDAFFQGDDSTRSETMPPVVVPNHNDRALRAFCEAVVITLLNIDESESDFETAVGGSASVPINDQLYWFCVQSLERCDHLRTSRQKTPLSLSMDLCAQPSHTSIGRS